MKLIGSFSKCHGVCSNNCEVCSVTNLPDKAGKFWLNMNFLLLSWRRKYPGKQAAKGKQSVFIFYLNPDKHTIIIKQTNFLNQDRANSRRYAVTVELFALKKGEATLPEIQLLSLVKLVHFWPFLCQAMFR